MKKYVIWFSKLKNTNAWLCMDISILHWVYLMTLWGEKTTTEHQQNWNLALLQTRFRFGQKSFENKLHVYAWQYDYAVKCMLQKYPGLISTVVSLATLLIIKYRSMYLDMFFWIVVICKQRKKMTIKDMGWKFKKKKKIITAYWTPTFIPMPEFFFAKFSRASMSTNPCCMDV